MLSAFTARPIIELKQRDKSKIETILAYGDRVFVGLSTGSLRVYRVNEQQPLPPPVPVPSTARESTNGSATSKGSKDNKLESSTSSPRPSTESARPPTSSSTTTTTTKPPPRPTDLQKELDKFSPRAIEQIAIIKEANTLVSLSNYSVHLHDLQTLEPLGPEFHPLPRTKNATCFAVTSNIVKDGDTGIPEIISRLAVAVKRRLVLWRWHAGELVTGPGAGAGAGAGAGGGTGSSTNNGKGGKSAAAATVGDDGVEEIVLAESIRTVTWASATKIVCGMNAGYVMVDVLTHAVEDIVAPGAIVGGASSAVAAAAGQVSGGGSRFGAMSSAGMGYMGLGGYIPRPLSAKLADGQVLLAKDINTLFVDDEGKPVLDKRQIPWGSAPESIGYSYPYILALQPPSKGLLEVRNPDTLSLIQNISLPGAAQLHFPPPTVSLAHAGKGFHISSDRVVWKMDATDYDYQVEVLLKTGRYDEAISVLGMLEDALLKDKVETLREVKMQKAEVLFGQKKFRESLDLFNEDEVYAPPERVLRLYPGVISGDSSAEEESGEESEKDSSDEVKDAEVVKDIADAPTSGLLSPVKAGTGLAKMLLGHRKTQSDAVSVKSATRVPANSDESTEGQEKSIEEPKGLHGKDLMTAVLELRGFLAGTRQRLQRVIDPATGYLKPRRSADGTNEEAFRTLLSKGTAKDESDDELEAQLNETFKLVDTCLFRAYMFSAPTLASSLFRIPNFCDPDVVKEKLLEHNRYNELVDFLYGKKLHREALELLKQFGSGDEPDEQAPLLHGPQRTIGYLQALAAEDIGLILEFSEWTLQADPEEAMEIFVADTEKAESLPRDRVVRFLDGIDTHLEIQYLEHIITELDDSTPDYHNKLMQLLIQDVKGRTRDKDWDKEMQKLVEFLSGSGKYSLSRAFGLIPKDDPGFYEAQAIVLSNMGQDKQALMVYVFNMKDYVKAEEYCNRTHLSRESSSPTSPSSPSSPTTDPDTETPSIYHTLLSLYLQPPPPHTALLEPALSLLSKHGSRLPATSSLSLIPDSLPVAELEAYFRGRIRAANSLVNESRIVAGLRKVELVSAQGTLLLGEDSSSSGGGGNGGLGGGGIGSRQTGRNRRVVVDAERVCGVCHKRLAGSVVAALADNSVVHYGCLGRVGGGNGGDAIGVGGGSASGMDALRRAPPSWGRRKESVG